MSNKKKSNEMWGGRFSEKSNDLLTKINSSIDIDKRLAFEDILGSQAHVEMLAKMNIITKQTKKKILSGLKKIEKELKDGDFVFDSLLEDIHMNIESRLREIIGSEAGIYTLQGLEMIKSSLTLDCGYEKLLKRWSSNYPNFR